MIERKETLESDAMIHSNFCHPAHNDEQQQHAAAAATTVHQHTEQQQQKYMAGIYIYLLVKELIWVVPRAKR